MSADASAFTSSRAHLVLVRVGVGLQQRRDVRAGRDVARDVGELGRRRDDRRAVGAAAGVAAAAGEQRQQEREAERHGEARARSLLKLIPIFSATEGSRSRPRDAPIAAMLCSKP